MGLEKDIGNYEDKPVVKFAKDVGRDLREQPIKVYSSAEIASAKHPQAMCSLCGQLGSDCKYAGQFVHRKCLRWTQKKVKDRNFKKK